MRQKLSIGAQLGFRRASSALVICALASYAPAQRQQPQRSARSGNRPIVLPIERSARFGALLVSLEVNGKPAVLILDTGSSATILSPEISGLSLPSLPRAAPPRKGTGFVGDGRWGQVTLTIGTTVWRDKRVLVVDTRDLSRALERKIDGILGQDILNEFKYVGIDLVEKQLTLGFE